MAILTQLASRYRWELMLLVGIPLIERTTLWLLPHILGNFNLSLDYWSCTPDYYCLPFYISPFLNISLYLLGFFYFHVRRTGRTTLTLLWAFAFVSEAVEQATYLLLAVDYLDEQWSTIEISGSGWSWQMGLGFLPTTMLVWFARQASRTSFNHALVFIGMAIALNSSPLYVPGIVFLPLEGRAGAWDNAGGSLVATLFALWVLARLDVPKEKHDTDIERWVGCLDIPVVGVPLRRLAAWALPRFDPARGISKELLVALFGLHWLLHAYLSLRYLVVYDFEPARFMMIVLYVFVYPPLWIVLVILLAYGIRARQPTEGPGTINPTAKPTKPFLSPSYGSEE